MEILTLLIAVFGVVGTFVGVYYTRISIIPSSNIEIKRNNSLKDKSTNMLDDILEKGVISIGIVHYPPLVDFNEKGGASGFYIEMMNWIARKNKLKVVYKPIKWNELRLSIDNQDVDIIMSIFSTPERLIYADFAAIMHRFNVGGVSLESNKKVLNHEDLDKDGVLIAVTKGEVGWEYAKNYLALDDNLRRITIIEEFDIKKMMGLVKAGVVDIALADSLSCYHYNKKESSLVNVFLTSPLNICDNGIMLKKGEVELKKWLDKNFSETRKNKKFQRKEKAFLKDLHDVVKSIQIYF